LRRQDFIYQAMLAANTCGCCEVRMADRPSSKEWRGSDFFRFHAVGSSHWQLETRIGRNVPCWQKWTGETSV